VRVAFRSAASFVACGCRCSPGVAGRIGGRIVTRWYVVLLPNGDPYAVRTDAEMAESYARNMGAGYKVVEVVPVERAENAS
jgi:hypothetical protein